MAEREAVEALMRRMSGQEFAVCMGMDAFRIAICMRPRNFTVDEVVRWLRAADSKGA